MPRTANLVLHINGTYRAQWADRLGYCKCHFKYLCLFLILDSLENLHFDLLAFLLLVHKSILTGKGIGAPLAFKCIKSNGGPVPLTFLGITRIYPVLYKEK